jgi:protein ERP2
MDVARMLLCLFLVLVSEKFLVAAFSQSLVSDFTFTLPAGRKECFFQTMKKDASLEIEYQVPGVYMICFYMGKG